MSRKSFWALMTWFIKHQWIQYFHRKSNIRRRRYCEVNMSDLDAVYHLGFDLKWMFTIPKPGRDPFCNSLSNSNNARLSYWWFSKYFPPFMGNCQSLCLRVRPNKMRQIWIRHRRIIDALNHMRFLIGRFVWAAQRRVNSKIEAKFDSCKT